MTKAEFTAWLESVGFASTYMMVDWDSRGATLSGGLAMAKRKKKTVEPEAPTPEAPAPPSPGAKQWWEKPYYGTSREKAKQAERRHEEMRRRFPGWTPGRTRHNEVPYEGREMPEGWVNPNLKGLGAEREVGPEDAAGWQNFITTDDTTWEEAANWLRSMGFARVCGGRWFWYPPWTRGPGIRVLVRLYSHIPWRVEVGVQDAEVVTKPKAGWSARGPVSLDLLSRNVVQPDDMTDADSSYKNLQHAVHVALVYYDSLVGHSSLTGLSADDEDWRGPQPLSWDGLRTWLNENLKWNRGDIHYAGRGWWYPAPPALVTGSGDLLPGEASSDGTVDRSRNYISVEEDRADDTHPAMFVDRNFNGISGSFYGTTPESVKTEVERLLMEWDEQELSGLSGLGEAGDAQWWRAHLATIRVLFRRDDSLELFGIPYEMRPGQSPRDLWRAGRTDGWIWLGSPGWWGHLDSVAQHEIRTFLAENAADVPDGPFEWSYIGRDRLSGMGTTALPRCARSTRQVQGKCIRKRSA